MYKPASEIYISTDASIPTTFTFPYPVYLEGNSDYCLSIGDLAHISSSLGASYTISGDQIIIGQARSTRKFCQDPPGVMAQETAFLAAMPQAEDVARALLR